MSLPSELRDAFRSLRATPIFTIASVSILAIGIGATSAVFSVINGMLLQPLPMHEPDRLIRVWLNDIERGFEHVPISYPEYLDWDERQSRFESMAALWSHGPHEGVWKVDGEARRIDIERVSPNFFEVLGVEVLHGRGFTDEDEYLTAVPPVLLSHELFRSRFSADPSIVGRVLPIQHRRIERFEVIGVLPPELRLGSNAELYVPTRAVDPQWLRDLVCECDLIARLGPGVTLGEGRAELQTIHEGLVAEDPTGQSRRFEVVATPLLDTVVGDAGAATLFLFGAVCSLLVIGVLNLAGLFLTRTAKRQRELAVRAAMGAPRSSLIRQMVVESALIAAMGLLAGWLVARWGIDVLIALGGDGLPRSEHISLDGVVLGFSAATAALSTLAFGVWPAIRASRVDLVDSLRGRVVGLVNTRLVAKLVVVEVAVAFVLLAAGSVIFRSLLASQAIEPGFRTENLLTIAVALPETKYPDVEARIQFHSLLREEVAALPGVVGATAGYQRPGGGWAGNSTSLQFEGQTPDKAVENPMASFTWTAPNYFRVVGIPVLAGRAFTEQDRLDSERVVIVSESVARMYWPGEDPLGKWVGHPRNESIRMRVVGVVADTRFRELRRPWQSLYFAIDQNPFSAEPARHPVSVPRELLVQTALEPEAVLPSVLARIRALDADIPLDDIVSFDTLMDRELDAPRLHAFLSSVFAFAGLLLAVTGIYGVVASFVSQRLPEFGLRLALGATPGGLRTFVVKRALRVCAMGLALGVALSIPVLRLAASLLYGVSPTDTLSFVTVGLALGTALLAAAYVPARGASQTDPMTFLRTE